MKPAAHASLCLTLALLALTPAAYAQRTLYSFVGNAAGDGLGVEVSGAGDVNADGFADVVATSLWENNGSSSGTAHVYSGLDGSVIWTIEAYGHFDDFGISVGGAGDMNGDGFDDVIVGAPMDHTNGARGTARVTSGADGSTLYLFQGDADGLQFGHEASGAGDVDADGFADVIVGDPYSEEAGQYTGSAWVFSGQTGGVLYKFVGAGPDAFFGSSVGGAGDVNGDGHDDLILRDFDTATNRARVHVLSGATGAALHVFDEDAQTDGFGGSVDGAGDVNGDGFDDVIIGASQDDDGGLNAGSARVYSGFDGALLYQFDGDSAGDNFGFSVSGAGDIDGDGLADLIVGALKDDENGKDSGSAAVFSGADGARLFTLYGDSQQDAFGRSVDGAGDVNGDGVDDLVTSAFFDDENGSNSGSVYVVSGCNDLGTQYCSPAVPNSTGLPAEIRACGRHTVADNQFSLVAIQLPKNRLAHFFTSQTQDFVQNPGGSQGHVCVGGTIGRFAKQVQNSGAGGIIGLEVDLTNIPPPAQHTIQAGETWNFQAWYRDKNPDHTSNFTDAVAVLFR